MDKKLKFGEAAVLLIAIFSGSLFFNPAVCRAKEEAAKVEAVKEVYQDKNNFFTFNPPAGWTREEIVSDTSSQVNFYAPGKKAALGVIAQLNEGEPNELFAQKKEYVKGFQQRLPKGSFNLAWDNLGERKVIKVNFEIPKVIKQEQYFFYDQGVRFDLVYGVANSADFKNYKQAAINAFATIQRQKPTPKK